MRQTIIDLIAAAIAVIFIASTRPAPMPSPWQVALVTIMMDRTTRWIIGYCSRIGRKGSKAARQGRHLTRVSRADIDRWASTDLRQTTEERRKEYAA